MEHAFELEDSNNKKTCTFRSKERFIQKLFNVFVIGGGIFISAIWIYNSFTFLVVNDLIIGYIYLVVGVVMIIVFIRLGCLVKKHHELMYRR